MTRTLTALRAAAIDPSRVAAIRTAGHDEEGNPFVPMPAEGGEPLRCCLTRAAEAEQIAVIAYAPFVRRSPWREVGPVFVHATQCPGYDETDALPEQLRSGARVLRSYRADGSLDYDHIAVVPSESDDIEPALAGLLAAPEVTTVHVRALVTQCFLYAVTRAG